MYNSQGFLPGLHYISAYMCVKWQVRRKMLRMCNHVKKESEWPLMTKIDHLSLKKEPFG